MLFSSLTFLFIFLPLVLLIYYLINEKYKNYILLFFSLLFYSWGEPIYVLLMIASIIFNYYMAIFIDENTDKKRKQLLIASIIVNISVLFVFKYLDFFIQNINIFFNKSINLINLGLPIGISFYTFQILSYTIDVYKKEVQVQKNVFYLGMYISFFPQLIAGPIVRYIDIEKQIRERKYSLDDICDGFRRFIIGFSKKVLISNNVAVIADLILNNYYEKDYGCFLLLVGIFAYTLQIYYDFSGYSDMAIGLGRMFGFKFLENFKYPYASTSITDFWRRWHISLSKWFRDYVYIPLGGNRCSKKRWIFNLLVVWLLTGLWHGASWTFIFWGIYYFVILIIEKLYLNRVLNRLPKAIKWVYSFILINIGWLIFRANSIHDLLNISKRIVLLKPSNILEFVLENYYLLHNSIFLIIGFIFMFPILKRTKKYENNILYIYLKDAILIVLLVLGIISLINDSYNPFIYFRF